MQAQAKDCDLIIIGGGPAGLAAAINAASEGIRTILLDSKDQGLGGQASASAAIENYPGFPKGVTGKELMGRFVEQAARFKTKILRPVVARGLKVEGDMRVVTTEEEEYQRIEAHAVILALGLSYKRLLANGVSEFLGRGVSYGMPTVDSDKAGQFFCIVGGANSAGQAAVHLSKIEGCSVKMLVRGDGIDDTMSQYLVERITAIQNIEVMTRTQVVEARGSAHLEEIVVQRESQPQTIQASGLYIFIGASPKTFWLNGMVEKSERGYILTGRHLTAWKDETRQPFPFETSVLGIFACGDVREGSTKRVASAVGEGSVAVQQVHSYFSLMHHSCTSHPPVGAAASVLAGAAR